MGHEVKVPPLENFYADYYTMASIALASCLAMCVVVRFLGRRGGLLFFMILTALASLLQLGLLNCECRERPVGETCCVRVEGPGGGGRHTTKGIGKGWVRLEDQFSVSCYSTISSLKRPVWGRRALIGMCIVTAFPPPPPPQSWSSNSEPSWLQ